MRVLPVELEPNSDSLASPLGDRAPVHAVVLSYLREVGFDAALAVHVQLAHDVPFQSHPLGCRCRLSSGHSPLCRMMKVRLVCW